MGSGLQKNQLVFESVIKIGWAEKSGWGNLSFLYFAQNVRYLKISSHSFFHHKFPNGKGIFAP